MVITGIHPIGQWLSRVACSIRTDLQNIMTCNKERGKRSWWPKIPPDDIAVCSQYQDPLQCIDIAYCSTYMWIDHISETATSAEVWFTNTIISLTVDWVFNAGNNQAPVNTQVWESKEPMVYQFEISGEDHCIDWEAFKASETKASSLCSSVDTDDQITCSWIRVPSELP